jgi:hypothetical protein
MTTPANCRVEWGAVICSYVIGILRPPFAMSGSEDASAGTVFRFSEGRYYVIRANALEDNFNFYGIVNLPSLEWRMSGWVDLSGCSGHAGDLGPRQKGLVPVAAMIGGVGVGGTAEKIGDLVMGGEEALSLSGRFEQLHDSLSSAGQLVTVFRPIVQALVLPMLDPRHDRPLRRAIACQLTGDHNPRCPTLFPQELAEQP